MSDTEDYPGPTHAQPEKKGQDPRGRANEDMAKPAARPLPSRVERSKPGAPKRRGLGSAPKKA
jgi:hypothetical protein